jgi:ABC-type Fe3+/spermidine/putrescine transport system ATPase subunit
MPHADASSANNKPSQPGRVGPALCLTSLAKSFDMNVVLADFSLEVHDGEFLTLLGPSGCGKTTLLNLIAGFYAPDQGRIEIGGHDVTSLPAHRRDTAMVFQNYALFPHLSVFENVAFGLRMRKGRLSKADIRRKVDRVLEQVKMGGMQDRYPHSLSGGQQQRVAVARAIVLEPAILLLDEPLSNLDAHLRDAMQLELRGLQREIGITTILVTHDQIEAFVVSDRIALMTAGRLEQLGTPDEIYCTPRSQAVAQFIGRMNRLHGEIVEGGRFRADLGDIPYETQIPGTWSPGTRGSLLVRPEHVSLSVENDGQNVAGTVESSIFLGSTTHYHIKVGQTPMVAYRLGGPELPSGPIYVGWQPTRAHFLPDRPGGNAEQ